MATATTKKKTRKQTTAKTNAKSTLTELNCVLINTSEDLIDNAVKTGEKYQKLFAKSIKKSEPLMEKNVDILFDTVEGIIGQAEQGTVRFKKLIGWNDKTVSKWRKRAEKNMNEFKKNAEETIEAVQSEIIDLIPGMEQPVKEAATKATKTATKTAKRATKTAAKATRRATNATKTTAKKATRATAKKAKSTVATAKKVAKKAPARKKKGLQVINGIGPKAEQILKAAGFTTVEKIAGASIEKIQTTIEKAGAPIRIDAKSWVAQAKKIAK